MTPPTRGTTIVQAAAFPVDAGYAYAHPLDIVDLWRLPDPQAWLAEHGGEVRILVSSSFFGATRELLDAMPALRLIANFGVGLDRYDLADVAARGVQLTATANALTEDVADSAFALLLAGVRRICDGDAFVRAGRWADGRYPLVRSVSASRLGIFGFGRIGRAIARRAEAFGMPVAYASRSPARPSVLYPRLEDLAALAAWSDVLMICAPATAETEGIVDARVLDALGPEGLLVNIARGSLVDEDALIAALAEGRLGGAALDVFRNEPDPDPRLLGVPNLVMVPHVGSATIESRRAMADHVYDNVRAYLRGEPLRDAV